MIIPAPERLQVERSGVQSQLGLCETVSNKKTQTVSLNCIINKRYTITATRKYRYASFNTSLAGSL